MDGFVKVKKKSRRKNRAEEFDESSELYLDKLYSRVKCIEDQFHDDDQLQETIVCFNAAISKLGSDVGIQCIVCYGLGSVSNSKNSLYQFALIHLMSLKYDVPLFVYDPIFTVADQKLFERFNCSVIPQNDEGKRKTELTTLFFTPHAPRLITENILRTNWGPTLCNCIIFGDDVTKIIVNTPSRIMEHDFPFMSQCQHFVEVVPLENKFKYSDIFNDLAFHVFAPTKLPAADPQSWVIESIATLTI